MKRTGEDTSTVSSPHTCPGLPYTVAWWITFSVWWEMVQRERDYVAKIPKDNWEKGFWWICVQIYQTFDHCWLQWLLCLRHCAVGVDRQSENGQCCYRRCFNVKSSIQSELTIKKLEQSERTFCWHSGRLRRKTESQLGTADGTRTLLARSSEPTWTPMHFNIRLQLQQIAMQCRNDCICIQNKTWCPVWGLAWVEEARSWRMTTGRATLRRAEHHIFTEAASTMELCSVRRPPVEWWWGNQLGGTRWGNQLLLPHFPHNWLLPPTTGFAGKVSTARAELGNISMWNKLMQFVLFSWG